MNILQTIVAQKRLEVAQLPQTENARAAVQRTVAKLGPRRDFVAALRAPGRPAPALIAEVKKASPSAGVIRPDFDPVQIARTYEAAGASCLSVLTDERFFQGSLSYLRQIREAVPLPLLRKDFIIDPRQIVEAAEWGADAILLIVAILTDAQLTEYLALAAAGQLSALVEVHDEMELERALQAGATLIGVNNRDLKTFQVDLATTERLAAQLRAPIRNRPSANLGPAAEILFVSESGIHTRADVVRVARAGVAAVLVGESLLRHRDIRRKIDELLGRSG